MGLFFRCRSAARWDCEARIAIASVTSCGIANARGVRGASDSRRALPDFRRHVRGTGVVQRGGTPILPYVRSNPTSIAKRTYAGRFANPIFSWMRCL